MRKTLSLVVLITFTLNSFAATAPGAASPAIPASTRLPVRHVVLYKNGVGYFEHTGAVHGNQEVTIDFTTGQLNDVLKSLTTLDLGNGRVTGVSYNSAAPLEQDLSSLRLPLNQETTLMDFLASLRGNRVELLSGGTTASGRVLSVDSTTEQKDQKEYKRNYVSLVSDEGEVRTFEVTPALTVRLLDREITDEVSRYMKVMASAKAQDLRRMTIATSGTGDRDLLVSYISEVPVWKSTYRIVMSAVAKPGDKPLLQGWAIVDNTVGEDWDNVELSLVAGAPQSFIQQLSQPLYARRPMVGLPTTAQLTPQTHESTSKEFDRISQMEALQPKSGLTVNEQKWLADRADRLSTNGSMAGGLVGRASESVAVTGATPVMAAPAPPPPPTIDMMESQGSSAATQELPDLFEYKLRQPVTIRKNQSALVPILQSRVEAERVSLWNPRLTHPLRALWLKNTSGLTLDQGTFSILDDQTFAGEGLLDSIRPGERRLLSYAADTALKIDVKHHNGQQRITKIIIKHGTMRQVQQQREEVEYLVRNNDSAARTLVVEHPQRDGWKLAERLTPEESTGTQYRFRVAVDAQKTSSLLVDESRTAEVAWAITNITPDQVVFFVRSHQITPEVETKLREVQAQKAAIALLESQIGTQNSRLDSIFHDQERLRENFRALKGTASEKTLLDRYTHELNQQEDELALLRKKIEDLTKQRDYAKAQLNSMIDKMDMEVEL